MPATRTKSLGTKVTEGEYATIAALAGEKRLSEWVRQVVLAAAAPGPADQVILAELLALRTILLNVHFVVATGETLTADMMHQLIDRADQDKIRKAQERLGSASTRREA
jgi:hypothetical protein